MTPEGFIELIAERTAEHSAPLVLDSRPSDWAEVLRESERHAEWFTERGVGRGDVVAVLAGAGIGTVASIFATWRIGATVTVLARAGATKRTNSSYSEWLAERLEQLAARIVLSEQPIDLAWPATEQGPNETYARLDPKPAKPFEQPPLILQLTSGSTGTPKIVPVTGEAARSNVDATAQRLGLSTKDSVVSWLPLNHDMGLIGTLIMPALHGTALRLSTPDSFIRSPMGWLHELSEARASLTFAPNFAYALIARYGRIRRPSSELDLSALRHCVNGSEPINADDFAAFAEFASEYGMPATAPRPGYGMAELGLVFSMLEPGEQPTVLRCEPNSLTQGARVRESEGEASTVIGCGTPLPGYGFDIRTETGESLSDGTVGEICVRGPSLFPGYLGRSREGYFWPDGAYRTGDLGFRSGGEVFVCGRIKDVIIVRGQNLVPQDIEQSVSGVDGVRAGNVAAFGVTKRGAESVVIVAESNKPTAKLREVITERVRDRVNTRPADVVLLGSGQLPKTTSGKLQRQLCKHNYLTGVWS